MSEISPFQGEEWRLKADNLLKQGRNFIETSNVGNQEEKQVLSDLLANVEANLSLLNGSRCDTREQLCDSENNHGVQRGIKHEHPEYFEDVPEDIKKSILIEKEKLSTLSAENQKLEDFIEGGSQFWNANQLEERKNLKNRIEEADVVLKESKESLEKYREYNATLEKNLNLLEEENNRARHSLHVYEAKAQEQEDNIIHKSKIIAIISANLEKLDKKLSTKHQHKMFLESSLENFFSEVNKIESTIEAFQTKMKSNLGFYNDLFKKMEGTSKEIEKCRSLNSKLEKYNDDEHQNQLNARKRLLSLANHLSKAENYCKLLEKKVIEVEEEQKRLEQRCNDLKMKTDNIERVELKSSQNLHDIQTKQLSGLQREMDILKTKGVTSNQVKSKVNDVLCQQEKVLTNLSKNQEQVKGLIKLHNNAIEHVLNDIKVLEIEKISAKEKVCNVSKTLKNNEELRFQLDAEISKLEQALIIREKACCALHEENRIISQNHMLIQNKIYEEKRKFKTLSRQLKAIQNDIVNTDQNILKEHYLNFHTRKIYDGMEIEVLNLEKKLKESSKRSDEQLNEILRLNNILQEGCKEEHRQKTLSRNILSDITMLESKMALKNVEREKMYSTVKNVINEIRKGEIQFDDSSKNTLKASNTLKALSMRSRRIEANIRDKKEKEFLLTSLKHNLMQRKIKNQVLTNELHRPLNVHKMRAEAGQLSQKMIDTMLKIRSMQKHYLHLSDELHEKSQLLHDQQMKRSLLLKSIEVNGILLRNEGRIADLGNTFKIFKDSLEKKIILSRERLQEKKASLHRMKEDLEIWEREVNISQNKIVSLQEDMKDIEMKWVLKQQQNFT